MLFYGSISAEKPVGFPSSAMLQSPGSHRRLSTWLPSSMVMWLIGLESDTQVGLLAICSFYSKTNIVNTYLCI